MDVKHLAKLPIWTTGFMIGYQDQAITLYFLTSAPELPDTPVSQLTEPPPPPEEVPIVHAAVTVSYAMAQGISESIAGAIAANQAKSENAP